MLSIVTATLSKIFRSHKISGVKLNSRAVRLHFHGNTGLLAEYFGSTAEGSVIVSYTEIMVVAPNCFAQISPVGIR